MKQTLADIEHAFIYMDADVGGENIVLICKKTGRFHFYTDMGDPDEDFPEDYDPDDYITVPDTKKFGLGSRLVMDFADEIVPDHAADIRHIFSRKGAYKRFRSWLQESGHLQAWYDYENERTDRAIRQWCSDNGIEIIEPDSAN